MQFTNPMEVSWAAMDRKLLHKFWSNKQDLYANAAAISDKVLVMNRGIHLVSLPGTVTALSVQIPLSSRDDTIQPIFGPHKLICSGSDSPVRVYHQNAIDNMRSQVRC